VIESNVGIITGSIPYLKPLFRILNPIPLGLSDGTATLSGQTPKNSSKRYARKDSSQFIYTGRPWYAESNEEATNTFMMLPPTNRTGQSDSEEEIFFKNTQGNIIKTTEISVLDSSKPGAGRSGSKNGYTISEEIVPAPFGN
jgi:hypothetical protein